MAPFSSLEMLVLGGLAVLSRPRMADLSLLALPGGRPPHADLVWVTYSITRISDGEMANLAPLLNTDSSALEGLYLERFLTHRLSCSPD